MKNIDKLRQMSTDEMATFLDDCGGDVPPDICKECTSCILPERECRYKTEKAAWKAWLEMEAS